MGKEKGRGIKITEDKVVKQAMREEESNLDRDGCEEKGTG